MGSQSRPHITPVTSPSPRRLWSKVRCENLRQMGIDKNGKIWDTGAFLLSKSGASAPAAVAAIHWTVKGFRPKAVSQCIDALDSIPPQNKEKDRCEGVLIYCFFLLAALLIFRSLSSRIKGMSPNKITVAQTFHWGSDKALAEYRESTTAVQMVVSIGVAGRTFRVSKFSGSASPVCLVSLTSSIIPLALPPDKLLIWVW